MVEIVLALAARTNEPIKNSLLADEGQFDKIGQSIRINVDKYHTQTYGLSFVSIRSRATIYLKLLEAIRKTIDKSDPVSEQAKYQSHRSAI